MGKIQEGDIHCPALEAALQRAMRKAFDNSSFPFGLSWPEEYGNGVSTKELLEGSDTCGGCGKKIEVDIHLKKIEGARNIETGQTAIIYDLFDNKISIKTSGTKCLQKGEQK